MEQSKYEGWQIAPIDNKNILEDFADDVCYTCDDFGNRKTFWKMAHYSLLTTILAQILPISAMCTARRT